MSDLGTFRAYGPRPKFNAARLDLIRAANVIIDEYEGQGYVMSLRQLYYQLVARDVIPNNANSYNNLGSAISDGRMAGLISWTAIEDRGRYLQGLKTQTSPASAIANARASYRRDLWEDQPCRVEVRLEKQALEGVVGDICHQLRVNFTSLKGYSSMSEMWRAGQRYAAYIQRGQRPIILHLGDHDPSGIDMTRDNQERLDLFVGTPVHVIRIALNMEQIEELKPPPNYAKATDSRFASYVERYGEQCWELDALSPDYIHRLIEMSVAPWRDQALWDKALKQETADKNELDVIIEELKDDD